MAATAAVIGRIALEEAGLRRMSRDFQQALANGVKAGRESMGEHGEQTAVRSLLADSKVVAAMVIALGLAVGGFLVGGIFSVHVGFRGSAVFRLNRFTGSIEFCLVNSSCRPIPESTSANGGALMHFLAGVIDVGAWACFLLSGLAFWIVLSRELAGTARQTDIYFRVASWVWPLFSLGLAVGLWRLAGFLGR